jgi:hypothetical protein
VSLCRTIAQFGRVRQYAITTGRAAEPSSSGAERATAESDFLLTKSENMALYVLISGIDARGRRPGEERLRLFENLPDRNLPRELKTEAISYLNRL